MVVVKMDGKNVNRVKNDFDIDILISDKKPFVVECVHEYSHTCSSSCKCPTREC